jgi:glycosyltransferase involved in cell wall biosynthesis
MCHARAANAVVLRLCSSSGFDHGASLTTMTDSSSGSTATSPSSPSSSTAPTSPPLRALHLASGNLFGGVEKTFLYYASAPRPSLLLPEFAVCFDGKLREGLRTRGAALHDLGPVRLRQPWTVQRARTGLRKLLSERRYDVVISHSPWLQVIFAPVVRERGIPLAFQLHDVANDTHWLDRLAKRYPPDVVVCNSKFTARTADRMFPGARTVHAYVPADLTTARPDADRRRAMRRALSASDDTFVIIQASRFERWKGHGLLLEALGRLARDQRWVCWITGDPQRDFERSYRDELTALADRLGIASRVHFLGHRQDMPELLGAADVMCQPNLAPEPFGSVFIEALHLGVPVVTTAMGAALEIIDEECGILATPEPDAVATAVTRLMNDVAWRDRLGTNAPVRAKAICDPARRFPEIVAAFGSARAAPQVEVGARAAMSLGGSGAAIGDLVERVVRSSGGHFGTLVDVGCGRGSMAGRLRDRFDRYVGCDLVAYDGFPDGAWAKRVQADLNRTPLPLSDSCADLVVSVETIEHLENPRAFVRELARIVRPAGRVVLTTPNQLSLLNKLTLLTRNQHNAFQEAPGLYPSHITALLEEDLRRIARECGLERVEIHYPGGGRVPLTGRSWPHWIGLAGRGFSDNVLLTAVRPG